MVNWYEYQNESDKVEACTDSDWLGAEGREDQQQADASREAAEAELGAAVKASQEVLGIMSLWKDVGDTTWGHVMGDASAAIGIIRRIGLGKMRHLNTSWLWVQEKEASLELQCHKVKGSDNSADLFTKALEHDSIRRHTEAMGCEFCGRDPIALTVNSLSATVSMEIFAMEMESLFKTKEGWTREQERTCTAKLTRPQTRGDRLGETLHTE